MSTDATNPAHDDAMDVTHDPIQDKGKGKLVQEEVTDEEDDEDDDDDDEEEDEEGDEEMAEEEDISEIDPSVIQPRRTRGKRVDYTSPEALAKAGLTPGDAAADDEEDTYESANDTSMQD